MDKVVRAVPLYKMYQPVVVVVAAGVEAVANVAAVVPLGAV